jgi:hypothetical protein
MKKLKPITYGYFLHKTQIKEYKSKANNTIVTHYNNSNQCYSVFGRDVFDAVRDSDIENLPLGLHKIKQDIMRIENEKKQDFEENIEQKKQKAIAKVIAKFDKNN